MGSFKINFLKKNIYYKFPLNFLNYRYTLLTQKYDFPRNINKRHAQVLMLVEGRQ